MKITAHIKTGGGKLVKQEVHTTDTREEWFSKLTKAGADGFTFYGNQAPTGWATILIRTADVAMWVVEE